MSTGSSSQLEFEISSANLSLAQLLRLLDNRMASLEDIKREINSLKSINPALLTEYVVPASGLTVMFYAARRCAARVGNSDESIELFGTLIRDCSAPVNFLDTIMGQNVMFYAAKGGDIALCKYLQSEGCKTNASDIHNQTPLFYSAREGHTDVVEWLVSTGECSINHIDRNGQTALFYASREDRFECVMTMVNTLGADPLLRDIYKKRARGYLKSAVQKRTYEFLTEVERARDPSSHASHRKLFVVRNEPMGAAAMKLRQHKPYNPYQKEEEEEPAPPAVPAKRQKSATNSPPSNPKPYKEKVEPPSRPARSERTSVAPSPLQLPVSEPAPPPNGRTRFRVKAPLGQGGLEAFEKEFPQFALWTPTGTLPSPSPATPPKTLNRPARAPPVGLTPAWVSVVSLLLRGPLWRYGPATIFHKPVFQLPSILPSKYHEEPNAPEKKLSMDLSVIRKKLEKGKYQRMSEVDKDVRIMFEQAYALAGGPSTNLGLLTKATETYYNQQLAGSGLAGVMRQEAENPQAHYVETIPQPETPSLE